MKLYNEDHIDEREIMRQVGRWSAQRLVTAEQAEAIKQAFPRRFREINPFLELGAFLFTVLAVMSLYSLVSLEFDVYQSETSSLFGVVSIVYAVGVLAFTRYLVRSNQLCRNGTDNALLVTAASIGVWGLLSVISSIRGMNSPFWLFALVTLLVLLPLIWYSGDVILSYLALAAFYGFLLDQLIDFSWGKAALPFVLMGASGGLYALVRREPKRAYYSDALGTVRWLALGVLLAAGNYFVVRELNGLLLNPIPATSPEIALSGLFWLLTFGLPTTYLLVGVRQRNRMFLILGTLGIAAAIATVRYYFGTWPLSIFLAVAGAAVIGVAAALIRYLRQPRYGLTDIPDDEPPHALVRHAGTLATIQATTNAQDHPHVRFGGGEFSGSGAGERY